MTGEELFNRYAPPILLALGWEDQPDEVKDAWEVLARKVVALQETEGL